MKKLIVLLLIAIPMMVMAQTHIAIEYFVNQIYTDLGCIIRPALKDTEEDGSVIYSNILHIPTDVPVTTVMNLITKKVASYSDVSFRDTWQPLSSTSIEAYIDIAGGILLVAIFLEEGVILFMYE
jgi:hypothetical protein